MSRAVKLDEIGERSIRLALILNLDYNISMRLDQREQRKVLFRHARF